MTSLTAVHAKLSVSGLTLMSINQPDLKTQLAA